MNPKFRSVYLLLGFTGLLYLVYHAITTFADGLNPVSILLIAIPDLVLFYLAYKTYPAEPEVKRQRIN